MITDACPECGAEHIDIQGLTFNKIAPMKGGRIDIMYRRVECTPPSDMRVVIDNNSGAGAWLRLYVMDVGATGSIRTVQVKGREGSWQGMSNTWGAAWEVSRAPNPPLDLRIVADDSQEVTAFGAISFDGQTGDVITGVQFSMNRTAQTSTPGSSKPTDTSKPIIDQQATNKVGFFDRLTIVVGTASGGSADAAANANYASSWSSVEDGVVTAFEDASGNEEENGVSGTYTPPSPVRKYAPAAPDMYVPAYPRRLLPPPSSLSNWDRSTFFDEEG
eukprot:jgi/Botrbrau1/16376/Bobra.85_2s0001.1